MKRLIFLVLFVASLSKIYSQTATIQTLTVPSGNVSVGVIFSGFNPNVAAFQFTIEYDPSYLTYVNVTDWFPGITGVGILTPSSGKITFVWGDTPVVVSGTLCKINFTYNGAGCTNISWSDNPTPRLISYYTNDYYEYTVNYVNGQVCPCTTVSISSHPSNQTICTGGNASFSVTAAGTTPYTYQWKYYNGSSWVNVSNGTPTGASYTGATTQTLNVSGISVTGNFQYRCYVTNCSGAGSANSNAATLTVNTVPAQPSPIVGNTSVCQGSSQNYSVTNVTGVTYNWSFPAGWTQTSGGNTNSVTVTVGASSGNVQVTPSNACGNGTPQTLPVSVVTSVPAQPSPITGNTSVCQGTSQNYSVTNVAGVTYNWSFPAGWTQTSGGNTNSVIVTVGASSGNVQVTPSNACGNGTPQTLPVSVTTNVPAQPSPITGNTSVCQGTSQNYSVTNVTGVTYNWSFPAGWTQTSGGNTNSVTVTVGASSGNVQVTPSNVCGNGTPQTLPVSVTTSVPAQPSPITGNTSVCQGTSQNYSVTNVAGVTYNWSFPAGWTQTSGGNTNSVTVTIGSSSGNVQVTPSNVCGNGTPQTLPVSVTTSVPAQPGPIAGNTSVCQGSSQNYSVTNVAGVTYNWSFPAGWTQTSGGNTNIVTVTVGSSSGNVQVTPSNVCGNGTPQTLPVTVSSPVTITTQPLKITTTPGGSGTFTVNANNVTTYTWQVSQSGYGGPYNNITSAGSNPTYSNWTTSSLGVSNVQLANNGWLYRCAMTNVCGTVTSDTASLRVQLACVPVSITTHPQSQTKCEGQSVTFTVSANGTQPFTYKWQKLSGTWTTIPGAPNSSSYTINNLLVSDAGSYRCVVYNCANQDSAISNVAVLTVNPTPAQPSAIAGPQTPCVGSTVNYSVNFVPNVTYQWTLPTGWTGTSSTNSINATVSSNSGQIIVTPYGNPGNCPGPQQTLNVTPNNLAANAGNDQTIPIGTSTMILGNATGGTFTYNYSWSPTSMISGNPNQQLITTVNLYADTEFTLTVNDGVCTATDKIWVFVQGGLLHIYDLFLSDDTICLGDSIRANVFIAGGNPPYTCTWSGNGIYVGGTPFDYIEAWPTSTGLHTYTVTVTDGTMTVDTSFTVFVATLPVADAGPDKIIGCGIPFTTIGTPETSGYTYSWQPTIGLNNASIAEPTAMPTSTTNYTVTVQNSYGCTATDVMTLTLINSVSANAGYDTIVCKNQPYQLQGTSDHGLIFSWTPTTGLNNANISNPVATINQTTTYVLTVTAGNCSSTDTVVLTVNPINLSLTYDCEDKTAIALPNGLVSYEFSVNGTVVQPAGISNTYQSNTIENTNIISVTATDEHGCNETANLTVDCFTDLPTAFTPDGDGINDVFAKGYDLTIFDRWGLKLYSGKEGWDGKYKSKLMPPATYFYKVIITNPDGSKTEKIGAVTLVKK